jgi:hypothetical protein
MPNPLSPWKNSQIGGNEPNSIEILGKAHGGFVKLNVPDDSYYTRVELVLSSGKKNEVQRIDIPKEVYDRMASLGEWQSGEPVEVTYGRNKHQVVVNEMEVRCLGIWQDPTIPWRADSRLDHRYFAQEVDFPVVPLVQQPGQSILDAIRQRTDDLIPDPAGDHLPLEKLQNARIKHVLNKEMTEEQQLEFVKESQYFVHKTYIDHPSDKVLDTILRGHPNEIVHVAHPSEKQLVAAIKREPGIAARLREPTEEMQMAAVKQDPGAIKYFDSPSKDVQMLALEKTSDHTLPVVTGDIRNMDPEVQVLAVQKNPQTIYNLGEAGVPCMEAQIAAWQHSEAKIWHRENQAFQDRFHPSNNRWDMYEDWNSRALVEALIQHPDHQSQILKLAGGRTEQQLFEETQPGLYAQVELLRTLGSGREDIIEAVHSALEGKGTLQQALPNTPKASMNLDDLLDDLSGRPTPAVAKVETAPAKPLSVTTPGT